jgi:maleate isomerase
VQKERSHVALIVPASNTVMEGDFHRGAGPRITVSTWRIFLEDVSREAEQRMLVVELPRSLPHIAHSRPDLVVFGCTSAGSLEGLKHDRTIARRIGDATGVPAVTVVASMAGGLSAIGARRVAVFTPYVDELTDSVAGCVAEAGHEVVCARGAGLQDNREIGAVEPRAIIEFVHAGMAGVRADALFLSCTNWRAMETLDALRADFGVPVLSSNQATLAAVHESLDRVSDPKSRSDGGAA